MADHILVDNGAGVDYTVASDEVTVDGYVGAAQVQLVKLVSGVNGETAPVGADTDTTAKRGLYVVAHRQQRRIAVASGGLTLVTTNYIPGDQMGTEFQFPNAARYTGGTGLITGVHIVDKIGVVGALDLIISRQAMTLAGDNAQWAISDVDALNVLSVIQLDVAISLTNQRFAQATGIAVPYDCVATTLFGSLVTRSASTTLFTAVNDIQVTLMVQQD